MTDPTSRQQELTDLSGLCAELSKRAITIRHSLGDSADASLSLGVRGASHNLTVAVDFVQQVDGLITLAQKALLDVEGE